MTGTIAITMAGLGSRFRKAGYTRPKYEIVVHGKPLFDWSLLSLAAFRDLGWRFHFIARAGFGAADYITARATPLGIEDFVVTELDDVTDGQATTAMIAARLAPHDAPFAVYNIDTFVAPSAIHPPDPAALGGWMPCFPAPGAGWSFARLDGVGHVGEVRENQRISDHATVGLYWFDSAARYGDCYDRYYADPANLEKGERYIAPMYNLLIQNGLPVGISQLSMDDVGMLGTPDQVAAFEQNPPQGAVSLIAPTTNPG